MFLEKIDTMVDVQSTIDWNELVYVLVGAIIGFLCSVLVIVIERAMDKKGKVCIYYKRMGLIDTDQYGFSRGSVENPYFCIPVDFELQNTSNTTRVIRDVSLCLYNGDNMVQKMYQISHISSTKYNGHEITKETETPFGGENNSYSFVLPPRSIQKQKCEYCFFSTNHEKFDKVLLRYYDEKDIPHFSFIMDIQNPWFGNQYPADTEWIKIDEGHTVTRANLCKKKEQHK